MSSVQCPMQFLAACGLIVLCVVSCVRKLGLTNYLAMKCSVAYLLSIMSAGCKNSAFEFSLCISVSVTFDMLPLLSCCPGV